MVSSTAKMPFKSLASGDTSQLLNVSQGFWTIKKATGDKMSPTAYKQSCVLYGFTALLIALNAFLNAIA